MPKYRVERYGDGSDAGPLVLSATHEIEVSWDEGEVRPPFLPQGAVLDLGGGEFWQVLTPIHYVATAEDSESFSYLVRGVKLR